MSESGSFLRRVIASALACSLVAAITVLCALTMGYTARAQEATPPETSFTLAQVPDTQNEVLSDDNPLMSNRYQWLADNRLALNLKFIAHSGDVVNWGVVDPIQYVRANIATNILDASGVPFSYAIGNHDTAAVQAGGSAGPGNVRENLRNTAMFNQYFPLTRFKNVEATFEPDKVDNMYQTFSAGGVDWLILTHEMWPRASVVQWMQDVVATHPRHNVIVNTHAFIDSTGALPTAGNYGDQNAQVEWDSFISQYANIKMVLSAHYGPKDGMGGYYYKESTGVNGNKVAQIMTAYHSNYQNHVRLLRIDTANQTITSSIYVNQSINAAYPSGYITDSASNFVASDMNWILPEGSTPPEPVLTAPLAPQSVTASAGITSASVSFNAPLSDGGSPITGYVVTANPGGITASGTTSPIVVTGLTAGTSYSFTVTAINAIGSSPDSTPSNVVTVLGLNPELLPDPGFEAGNGGWIAFSTGTLSRVTSPVRGGATALKVVRASTAAKTVGLTLNNVVNNSVAGTTYVASCYVRPSVSGLSLTMRFLEYPQNFSTATHFGTNVNIASLPANVWTPVEVRATAVKSGERMIPQIYSANQYKSTGSIVYDDCSLKVAQ